MSKKLPTLERRRRAVEATKQRFAGKAFKLGSADCVKLMRFHAIKLGHKLPSTGHYSNAAEAVKQLKKHGAKNLEQLCDKLFERIAPAAMLLGDLALIPAEPEAGASIGTVVIKVAASKYLGWHPDYNMPAIMDISEINAAWRL